MSAQSVKEAKAVASKEQHVLIIGRPEIFVDGIVGILESGSADYRVTCVAPGAPCMRYFVGNGPDYLLIQDTAKPEPFEDFVTEMVEGFSDLRLLVFGQKMSDDFLYRILRAGAHGYFNERMSGDHILQALTVVSQGKYWAERHIMEKFITDRSISEGIHARTCELGARLTSRETEVLELILRGMSTSEIAENIFLSHQGVKAHLTSLFRKFEVRNRSQLILRALDEVSPVESITRLVQNGLQEYRDPGQQLLAS